MKLTQFDADVNRNITNGRVSPAGDMISFGADTKGAQALIGAIGAAGDLYKKQWMKNENDKIIDATNDYMMRINSLMDDENKGLFVTHQGKNSESLQNDYQNAEKEIYNSVLKDHGLSTEYARQAFSIKRNTLQIGTLDSIDKYQRSQLDIYAANQAQTLLDNTIDSIISNPGNMRNSMNTFMPLLRANMAGRGWDEDTINLKVRNTVNTIAEKALTSMDITNDYSAGLDAIDYFRTLSADEATMKKYESLFTTSKAESDTKKGFAESLTEDKIDCITANFNEYYKKWSEANPVVIPNNTNLGRIGNKIAKELGWDPSWGYAVADYESAGGDAAPRNNYFGIKWDGQGEYQELNTRELDENGNEYYVKDKFKVYNSPEEAAMSYVEWIKRNCTKEEIKSVHSPTDVALLMKKHGYYTDNSETYAAGLESRARNYHSSISSEEKEKIEANRERMAKSEWEKRKQQQNEELSRTLDDMKIPMATMTPQEKQSYINRIAAGNTIFANSSQYKSLMANAKAQERIAGNIDGSTNGYASNKMVNNLIGLIGTGIVSREDLDNKMALAAENGYALSDTQKGMIESAWDRYQKGDKEFSVEIPSAKELADYTGVDSSQFDETTRGLIRQRIYQYNNNQYQMIPNPNNYPATQDVVKRIAQEVVQNKLIYHNGHWFKEDEDYYVNMNGLARAGVTEYTPYGNGMFQVLGRNGESFWCTAAQLQDINDGKKTMLDVMQENS